MRLVGLALSAALLSGCSFVNGMGQKVGSVFNGKSAAHHGTYGGGYADPCQIPHAQAPIPRGCHPSQVSIGVPGGAPSHFAAHPSGFAQTPQFGQPQRTGPQYTTGQYGTHASGNAHTSHYQGASAPKLRRPRFRGALDLGVERSISGNVLDTAVIPTDPFAGYNPDNYNESRTVGTVVDGQVDNITYFANSRLQNTTDPWDEERVPDISFSDAWSVPTTIGASGEFILNDRATLFARAGYTRAEGTNGGAASLDATVFKRTVSTNYEVDDNGVYQVVGTTTGTEFRPENQIAEISYDFSDLERYDLEAGGRLYLNPIAGQATGRTVTPFIGASAGASHFNAVSYTLDQRQLSYTSVYEDEELFYYDVDDNPTNAARGTRVDLYDAQWVPTGRLNAGLEWQVTPKTALAFETGVRFEGARDYSDGSKGDSNISIPLTLRGSFNF